MRYIFALLLPAVALSGCAVMDTGEIDYRRAEVPTAEAVNDKLRQYVTNCESTAPVGGASLEPCLPLLPERLFRQNVGNYAAISPKDVYSISLEHGVLANFVEPPFAMRRVAALRNPLKRIGEIVILANTFEFSSDTATTVRFKDFTEFGQTKVVYYNPDVEIGQDMNFSNIPLQAPTVYQGNPVGIQIIVIELDRTSAQMKTLLGKLAELGKASNLVPGGQVGSVLLDLGTALASQNHDDTVFEYRFVLDPSRGTVAGSSSPFEAGRYVLMRTQHRNEQANWRNLYIDHNTGGLFEYQSTEPGTDKKKYAPFSKQSYLTLNVIKHPDGTKASFYQTRTMETLSEEIAAAANERDKPLAVLADAAGRKAVELWTDQRSTDLAEAWTATEIKALKFAQLSVPKTLPVGCAKLASAVKAADVAQAEAMAAAIEFITLFREARAKTYDDTPGGKAVFGLDRQKQLLGLLVPYFAPFDGSAVTQQELLDPQQFFARTGADSMAFANAVSAEATRQGEGKSCEELLVLGIAEASTP